MSTKKTSKRVAQLKKQLEEKQKEQTKSRKSRQPKPKSSANVAEVKKTVQGFWNNLPVPFVARLLDFLSVPDIQRCFASCFIRLEEGYACSIVQGSVQKVFACSA